MQQEKEIVFTPIIIFILLVAIPFVSRHDTFGLGVVGWTIVSAITGAIAFVMNRPGTPILSLLCGAMIGAGIQISAYFYSKDILKDRDSFFAFEFILPFIAGAVPGILIYNIGLGLADLFSFLKGPKKP